MATNSKAKTDAKPAAKKAANQDETKAQRFSRLANKRVPKTLKAIANIGNLSGAGYESTPEQRAKIEAALREAVDAAVQRLNGTKSGGVSFSV